MHKEGTGWRGGTTARVQLHEDCALAFPWPLAVAVAYELSVALMSERRCDVDKLQLREDYAPTFAGLRASRGYAYVCGKE
jgi:hypothetical protein